MNETNFSSHVNPTSGLRSSVQETRTSLKDARFAHRTEALFRSLSSDFLLREQFVSDPARTFAEYVLDERVGEDLAETANHLLYAVVSSQRLAHWLISYARQLKRKVPPRHVLATSLAQAVARSGDEVAVLALIHAAASESDHFSLQADLLRAIAVALGGYRGHGSSGTEFTPGPGPGTEVSPGRTIPFGEVTQVIATIQRVIRGNPGVFTSGTESTPGPGPGTEKTPGPGPGTEVSPGREISIGEMTRVLQLIQRAVRGNPGVFSSGTEFTPGPGPGTEQTPGPGPGTEVSPGRVFSAGELARVLQAIQLVARKNPGVFSSGTESTPGPGPGTEKTPGPGPGTEVSPGGVISIGEMTRVLEGIQRAVRLNPGAFSSGTEMTPGPGPGTEATPGPQPGTESTPGSIFRGLGYLSVTMEALARYALQLRSNQVLLVSGVEDR